MPQINSALGISTEKGASSTNASRIDNSFKLVGWKYSNIKMQESTKTYPTNWGALTASKDLSRYSRITVALQIRREGWGLFLKIFSGAYVALLISMLVFFIDPIEVDPRFGLGVGGLFASVANKYVVDSALPSNLVFSLTDKIHLMVFVAILISIILSVISLHFHKRGKGHISKEIDVYGFVGLLIIVILVNVFLVMHALS